jgi:hypothetical protein
MSQLNINKSSTVSTQPSATSSVTTVTTVSASSTSASDDCESATTLDQEEEWSHLIERIYNHGRFFISNDLMQNLLNKIKEW